jgi:hypothetical protein
VTTGPGDPEVTVWLNTQLQPDEQYIVTLSIGEDYAVELTVELALSHAVEVLRHVALADYAQAIRKQMTRIGTEAEAVEDLLRSLVPKLPLAAPVTALAMMPAINRKTGEPLLQLSFKDELLGVWTLQQARSHALGVLEAMLAADLDTSYRQVLMDVVELDGNTAAGVISDIGTQRWPV